MTDRTRLVADLRAGAKTGWIANREITLGAAADLIERMDELERDAARYAWLKDRLHSADFKYQTADDESISVLVFDVTGHPVSANLDATIEAALTTTAQENAK